MVINRHPSHGNLFHSMPLGGYRRMEGDAEFQNHSFAAVNIDDKNSPLKRGIFSTGCFYHEFNKVVFPKKFS